MNIKIITFYLLGAMCLSSCISLVANFAGKRFDERMKEAENNTSTISYSDDYHVYKTRKTFTYEVHQIMDSTSVNFELDLIVFNKSSDGFSTVINFRKLFQKWYQIKKLSILWVFIPTYNWQCALRLKHISRWRVVQNHCIFHISAYFGHIFSKNTL